MLPSLEFRGLHSHIGSQIFDALGFEEAAVRIVAFMGHVSREIGISVDELDLGGGMGIAYLESDDPLAIDELAARVAAAVAHDCAAIGIPLPELAFEPGRAIIGPPGVTLYEIGTVKSVQTDEGVRTYVSVDGGMSDNIRTALYDAEYTVALASRISDAELIRVRVVGKHCESGDILIRDAMLPADLAPGDLLVVAATGAYCRSMASNYNYLPRPAVIGVKAGESTVILRRETLEDQLALDPGA